MTAPAPPAGAPKMVGKYRLVRKIGQGGAGFVYEAVETENDYPVALKLFAGIVDPLGRERFVQEAQLASRLDHPNLVHIFDAGEADGKLFIAYELLDPRDLDRVLEEHAALQAADAVAIVIQIARALGELHSRGILHRDVKPANIFRRPGDDAWVLGDLGVAKDRGGHGPRTGSGIMMGTPEYIAPEYSKGDAPGEAADQYSLGVVLFELISGRRPHEGRTIEEMMRAQLTEPIDQTYLPPHAELRKVVMRMLATEPSDRYPGMRFVIKALEKLEGLERLDIQVSDRRDDPSETHGRRRRRRRSSHGRTRPNLADAPASPPGQVPMAPAAALVLLLAALCWWLL